MEKHFWVEIMMGLLALCVALLLDHLEDNLGMVTVFSLIGAVLFFSGMSHGLRQLNQREGDDNPSEIKEI